MTERSCTTPAEQEEIGYYLLELAADQAEWSQETFGTDDERGPIGALKHLQNEAVDIVRYAAAAGHPAPANEDLKEELADCLLLLLDANRRAGFTPQTLIHAAQAKMNVNRTRTYPKPTSDVPSEHIRDETA